MGHILNWSFIGFFGILFLSIVFTPVLCNTISNENPEVTCSVEDNVSIFFNIYSTVYGFVLLGLGIILGMLVGRVIALVDKERGKFADQIYQKEKNKRFLWMWEK